MTLLLSAVAVLAGSGILAGLTSRRAGWPAAFGMAGLFIATLLGVPACVMAMLPGHAPEMMSAAWKVPGGAFSVRLDALAAFFILPILIVSLLCGLYGAEYLRAYMPRKAMGGVWCFFNLLVASMITVVLAHNAVLFLVAWEVMALASFFLVAFEDEHGEVRRAAWLYLVATHLGTAALLAMFVLLGAPDGSFEFSAFGKNLTPSAAAAIFLLAVVGFGAKAGFAPFHVWLPEAHPAAPSHVSAIMSGLMIKTGIYGLLRIVLCLGTPPLWWGYLLIAIGLAGGIGGILFAFAQSDAKRLLAYSSVENIGIIALGLGLGLVGWTTGNTLVSLLGFAGALLHVLNHSLFKSLLFLGAGTVLHATHTRNMDSLGGLLKPMPHTGSAFLAGSMAISGLPPFNGFVGEFLIFLGAFEGITQKASPELGPSAAVIGGLALISGLAAACFTKIFGTVFLGEPRSDHTAHAHDPGWRMRAPMWLLAATCLGIGLGAPYVIQALGEPLRVLRPELWTPDASNPLAREIHLLGRIVAMSVFVVAVLVALLTFRALLLRGREVTRAGTWDCGYARPTPRMQYTSSSFAQPLTELLRAILRGRRYGEPVRGLFPKPASLSTATPDVCMEGIYHPFFVSAEWAMARLRRLQHGNIHLYVLYVAVTLLILLLWKMS